MALVLPALKYTPSGGSPTTINFTEALADEPFFSPEVSARDSFGGSGIWQRNVDYQYETAVLSFQFVTQAERDSVITMWKDHVLKGGSFDFIPDQGVPATFHTVEAIVKEIPELRRMFTNLARYEFKVTVRKKIT